MWAFTVLCTENRSFFCCHISKKQIRSAAKCTITQCSSGKNNTSNTMLYKNKSTQQPCKCITNPSLYSHCCFFFYFKNTFNILLAPTDVILTDRIGYCTRLQPFLSLHSWQTPEFDISTNSAPIKFTSLLFPPKINIRLSVLLAPHTHAHTHTH